MPRNRGKQQNFYQEDNLQNDIKNYPKTETIYPTTLDKQIDYLVYPNQQISNRLEIKSGKQLILPENFLEIYGDIMVWEAVPTVIAKSKYRIPDPNEYDGIHIHAREYSKSGSIKGSKAINNFDTRHG
jgi:hypothetical protein